MTLRGRGIEIKKLNRKRKEKERKKRKMKKREREEKKEKREREKEGERGRTRKLPARPPTEKPNSTTTTHPVAPANYIMIFNGPKSKTRPPKIFGSGISWDGLESSEMA